MEDVRVAVDEIIRKVMPDLVGEIPMSARFEDIGMDSMTMVDLILKLEADFTVEIPDGDVNGMRRIQDVVNYLELAVRARRPG